MLSLLCCSSLPPRPARSQGDAPIPALQGPFPRRRGCGDGGDVHGTGSTSLLDAAETAALPNPDGSVAPEPELHVGVCSLPISGFGSGKVALNVSNGIGLNE